MDLVPGVHILATMANNRVIPKLLSLLLWALLSWVICDFRVGILDRWCVNLNISLFSSIEWSDSPHHTLYSHAVTEWPCPSHAECEGLDPDSQIVDGTTIDQFRGCSIVTTGGVLIGDVADTSFEWVVVMVMHLFTHVHKCYSVSPIAILILVKVMAVFIAKSPSNLIKPKSLNRVYDVALPVLQCTLITLQGYELIH